MLREGKQVGEEARLSLPDIREKVSRAAKVKVRAQDVKGNWHEYEGDELLARAFQHEIDHLNGVLFIFRISALKRDLVLRRIRKLQRAGEWVTHEAGFIAACSAFAVPTLRKLAGVWTFHRIGRHAAGPAHWPQPDFDAASRQAAGARTGSARSTTGKDQDQRRVRSAASRHPA